MLSMSWSNCAALSSGFAHGEVPIPKLLRIAFWGIARIIGCVARPTRERFGVSSILARPNRQDSAKAHYGIDYAFPISQEILLILKKYGFGR